MRVVLFVAVNRWTRFLTVLCMCSTDLVGLKLKMYQNQGGVGQGAKSAWTASDPLHFHLDGETVVIDEVTVEPQTSEYYLDNINKFTKVCVLLLPHSTHNRTTRGDDDQTAFLLIQPPSGS